MIEATSAPRPPGGPLHLLMREGALLSAPSPVAADAEGRLVADLYAVPLLRALTCGR